MKCIPLLLAGGLGLMLTACASTEPEPTGVVSQYKTFSVLTADGNEAADALLTDGRIVLKGFNFTTDSVVLNEQAKLGLARLGPALNRPDALSTNIAVVGHTDNTGDHDYNIGLSERRAEAIRTALVDGYGVDPRRLVAVGLGPMAPLEPNDTPDGRSANRRVELWVVN